MIMPQFRDYAEQTCNDSSIFAGDVGSVGIAFILLFATGL